MLKDGLRYEALALKFLQKHKLKFLERNFHSRYGEIDLIMMEQDTLVFVEVRYRKSDTFGSAKESITTGKQRKIIKTAQIYIQKNDLWHLNARFDVIALSPSQKLLTSVNYEWLEAAFSID